MLNATNDSDDNLTVKLCGGKLPGTLTDNLRFVRTNAVLRRVPLLDYGYYQELYRTLKLNRALSGYEF